jgi:hypothetical protein
MEEPARKDLIEGEEAFRRFDSLVGKVLSGPREVILRRDAEHNKRSAMTGKKRGPKPKQAEVSPTLPPSLPFRSPLAFAPPSRSTPCR